MKAFSALLVSILLFSCLSFSYGGQKYEKPILISSAGQSADVTLASTLFKKIKVEATANPLAKEADLNGVKTLVIVPGFSSKGLGAAGISREQELDRVKSLIAAAKKKNIKIVMLHIGGKARRGAQSDDFNKFVADASSYMIVVKQGDEDQFFTKIGEQKKIPVKVIEKIAESIPVLQEIFK